MERAMPQSRLRIRYPGCESSGWEIGIMLSFISEKCFIRLCLCETQKGARDLHLQGSTPVLEGAWSPWHEQAPELCSHLHAPGACNCIQRALKAPGENSVEGLFWFYFMPHHKITSLLQLKCSVHFCMHTLYFRRLLCADKTEQNIPCKKQL